MHYTVLGANGFVGQALTQSLRNDGHVPFTPVRGDAAVFERELGCVFYCVGMTADFAKHPSQTVEAHAGLISRIVEHAKFEHIVYLSSTRLYDQLDRETCGGDAILSIDPHSARHLYDLSKALGENLCLTAAAGRASVARLSGVFDASEGAPGFLSQWLQRAARETVFVIDSSAGVVRDYIHVSDVVLALRRIAEHRVNDIVNVASGENVSNAEIAAVFNEHGWTIAMARDGDRQHLPVCNVEALAALGVKPQKVRDVVEKWTRGVGGHEAH